MARRKRKTKSNIFKNLFTLIYWSSFGKIIIFLIIVSFVIICNILITKNSIDKFLTLTGAELLILIIILWISFLFKKK